MKRTACQIRRVSRSAGVLFVVLASCVPTARSRPSSEETWNEPTPPGRARTAGGMLAQLPTADTTPAAPPAGSAGHPRRGAWRWTGTEYRWVVTETEPSQPNYVWKRP